MNATTSSKLKVKKKRDSDFLPMCLMITPTVFFILLLNVYPFLWIFRYMFYDYDGFNAYFIGFDNFTRAFNDTFYWSSVVHTFEYASLKLLFVLPLSLFVAVIIQRKGLGHSVFQTIYFMPTVISSAVYSLIWYFIFSAYNGVLNGYLQSIGIIDAPIDWLGNAQIAMFAVVIVAVWGGFGNYMILLVSGITGIGTELYESANIDGANGIQTFFKITLPMLGPVLKVVMMIAITGALKDYQSILVLTGGGPNNRTQVMFLYIFQKVFGGTDGGTLQIGYGAVLSMISAVIIGFVTVLFLKFSKKMDDI